MADEKLPDGKEETLTLEEARLALAEYKAILEAKTLQLDEIKVEADTTKVELDVIKVERDATRVELDEAKSVLEVKEVTLNNNQNALVDSLSLIDNLFAQLEPYLPENILSSLRSNFENQITKKLRGE